jgi:CheY-like chemotaxis protein
MIEKASGLRRGQELTEKRILIVDDEESVAFFLAENLAELRAGYLVETATSGEAALSRMAAQTFDLVITDLRMPGINGLELIQQARTHSPHMRLILMTAYGNTRIEAAAYRLGACRYLSKPFQIQELVTAVQAALTEVKTPGRDILVLSDNRFDEIARCLADLRFELSAQCILLADVTGQMLAHVGTIEDVDLPVLISLISGSFATAFEMARHLGEEEALTLNYHEGKNLDVYSANVNKELFIVLLFDKGPERSRIGMVWLYTRRMLQQLRALVRGAERVPVGQVLDGEFGTLLSTSLDQLLVDSSTPAGETGWEIEAGTEKREPTLVEATQALLNSLPEAPPPSIPAKTACAATTETFDLDQALKMGLLDPSWANSLDGRE